MALTFPSSPTNGQYYTDSVTGNRYVYNAASGVWTFAANNVGMSISSTPPANVASGALWYNREIGRTFVYYDDGDSKQWVETVPATGFFDSSTVAGYANAATQIYLTPVYNTANAAYSKANAALPNVSNAVFDGNLRVTGVLSIGSNTITITDKHIVANDYYRMNTSGHMVAVVDGNKVNAIYTVANAAFDSANNVGPQIAPAFNTANAAFASANNVAPQVTPAFQTANLAYAAANASLQNTNVTLAGNLRSTGVVTLNKFPFYESTANIDYDYTISTGMNALTPGPVAIANGVYVTIPSGSYWSVT